MSPIIININCLPAHNSLLLICHKVQLPSRNHFMIPSPCYQFIFLSLSLSHETKLTQGAASGHGGSTRASHARMAMHSGSPCSLQRRRCSCGRHVPSPGGGGGRALLHGPPCSQAKPSSLSTAMAIGPCNRLKIGILVIKK